jgi:hypothetical protein
MVSAWASARLDGRETGATELRQALAAYTNQGNKLFAPFFQGLLAEIEAQGDAEGALTRIDEALALANEIGEHWSAAFLQQCRARCRELLGSQRRPDAGLGLQRPIRAQCE